MTQRQFDVRKKVASTLNANERQALEMEARNMAARFLGQMNTYSSEFKALVANHMTAKANSEMQSLATRQGEFEDGTQVSDDHGSLFR